MERPKPIEVNYFVVTNTGLLVGYRSDQHFYPACTAEVQIASAVLIFLLLLPLKSYLVRKMMATPPKPEE